MIKGRYTGIPYCDTESKMAVSDPKYGRVHLAMKSTYDTDYDDGQSVRDDIFGRCDHIFSDLEDQGVNRDQGHVSATKRKIGHILREGKQMDNRVDDLFVQVPDLTPAMNDDESPTKHREWNFLNMNSLSTRATEFTTNDGRRATLDTLDQPLEEEQYDDISENSESLNVDNFFKKQTLAQKIELEAQEFEVCSLDIKGNEMCMYRLIRFLSCGTFPKKPWGHPRNT